MLTHELGHEQLAPKGAGYYFFSENTCMEPKVEYEANRLAVEYLGMVALFLYTSGLGSGEFGPVWCIP